MIALRTILVAGLLGLGAPAASAADSHSGPGPNGGRIEEGGAYHLELVTKESRVDVYVSDMDQKPVAAALFKGTAILVVDGKPARITLEPATGNRLSGDAGGPIAATVKGAIRLVQPDGKTLSVSFH